VATSSTKPRPRPSPAFKKDVADSLKAAGYPAKAKPIEMMSGQW
jgi:hypothetical protein